MYMYWVNVLNTYYYYLWFWYTILDIVYATTDTRVTLSLIRSFFVVRVALYVYIWFNDFYQILWWLSVHRDSNGRQRRVLWCDRYRYEHDTCCDKIIETGSVAVARLCRLSRCAERHLKRGKTLIIYVYNTYTTVLYTHKSVNIIKQ